MKLVIDIPEEFEGDFSENKFSDAFNRAIYAIDNKGLCGNYEKETFEMLSTAFKDATIIEAENEIDEPEF